MSPPAAARSAGTPSVAELFDLTGQVALLTGASGWLGGAFARALAEAGARVVASSRELSRAQALVSSLPNPGGAAHAAVEMDQMDEASVRRGFQEAVSLGGGLDILVNNGYERAAADWTEVSAADFDRHLINVTAYFLLARHFRQSLRERGASGNVVMIGSMWGVVGSYPDDYAGVGPAAPVAYHAMKGALVQMTRHLSVSWASDGVRVNCLSPGPFPRPGVLQPESVRRLHVRSPMGRMGVASELKGALLLLVSRAGSYITGQNLLVDGGWTVW